MTLIRERVSAANDSALRPIRNPSLRAELIGHIVDAVQAVNDDQADIVLLAARRMSSLYTLLNATDLPPLTRGFVVSDRFIQLLPDGAWEGQRVILLDDTRLSGATIADRVESAKRLVGATGTVDARVAVDLNTSDSAVIGALTLHNQFAAAFGTNLIPFFTDFAVSSEFETAAGAVDRVLAADRWRTVDVTNSVIAGTGSRSFSLFPVGEFRDAVEQTFGGAGDLVDVAKIRLFIGDNYGQLRARFVPIVLMRDLDPGHLRAWFRDLKRPVRDTDAWVSTAAGLAAMVLSRALFEVFARTLQSEFGISATEDTKMATLALGPDLHDFANHELIATLDALAPSAPPVSDEGALSFAWPTEQRDPNAHFAVAGDDLVRGPYDLLLDLKRASQQQQIPWALAALPLAAMAKRTGGSSITLSIALDVLNDLGYCVPGHGVRDGRVVRTYRPGESVEDYDKLLAGAFGGRLASVTETVVIPDETYYGEEILREPRGLG